MDLSVRIESTVSLRFFLGSDGGAKRERGRRPLLSGAFFTSSALDIV